MGNRNYSSTVTERTLAAAMDNSQATMQLNVISGVPTFPFTMVIAPDTTVEEIVTVTGISGGGGDTFTVTRGQDGTTAVEHGLTTDTVSTKVRHMITARDLQEPQDHFNNPTNVHGIADTSLLLTTTNTKTGITNKSFTAAVLDANSTIGGVSGTTLAANQGSWLTWTPTWSGTSVNATGASSPSYKYSIIGKTVNFRISVVKGTSNFGTADLAFSTPTGYTPLATTVGDAVFNNGTQRYPGTAIISSAGTITPLANPDVTGTLNYGRSPTNTTVPFTWGTSDSIIITGTYEVA